MSALMTKALIGTRLKKFKGEIPMRCVLRDFSGKYLSAIDEEGGIFISTWDSDKFKALLFSEEKVNEVVKKIAKNNGFHARVEIA